MRISARGLSTFGLAISVACSSESSVPSTGPDPDPIPLPSRSGRIVFQGNCPDGRDIFTIAADGTDRRRLTVAPGFNVEPVWSHDGSKIAFSALPDDMGNLITVMDADGTNRRDITSPNADRNPTWSPDGRIAFESRRTSYARIAIVNGDGSGLFELPGFAIDPAWSPDGRSFAYMTTGPNGGWMIAVMDADGGNARPLTNNTIAIASDQNPAWSPDGRRVVFVRWWQSDSSAIHIIDADGRNQRRLPAMRAVTPAWSPNGQQLVFSHAEPGGLAHLYVINADGTSLRQLTDGSCQEMNPSW
jgi:Tol biopolymer transport system component